MAFHIPSEIVSKIIETLISECGCHKKTIMLVSKQWNELVSNIRPVKPIGMTMRTIHIDKYNKECFSYDGQSIYHGHSAIFQIKIRARINKFTKRFVKKNGDFITNNTCFCGECIRTEHYQHKITATVIEDERLLAIMNDTIDKCTGQIKIKIGQGTYDNVEETIMFSSVTIKKIKTVSGMIDVSDIKPSSTNHLCKILFTPQVRMEDGTFRFALVALQIID
jgi:hypothetical protein